MNSDFDRFFTPVNFEDTTDEIVDIYLRFKDGFSDTWGKNPNNTLSFNRVKTLLTQSPIDCFFQKQQKDEKNNKARQKILVPVGDDIAIELRVSLSLYRVDTFTTLYSYFVGKCRETLFVREPEKDTLKVKCQLHFVESGKPAGTKAQAFQNLFRKVDAMNVPVLDINKDKDREIWNRYVEALRTLVKGKEQIWKINRVSSPYVETYNGNERTTYMDIYVSEKDIIKQFEDEIENFFTPNEIEDFGVNEDQAFIEFNSYRELSPTEKVQLSELAGEFFYELPDKAPKYSISGELTFKYTEDISKDAIYSKIESLLYEEYQIDVDIDGDGKLETELQNIPHVSKVVKDRYASILEVKKNCSSKLSVSITSEDDAKIDLKEVQKYLIGNGLDRAQVYMSANKKQIAVEVNAYIRNDFFNEIGLRHVKNVFRFGNGRKPAEDVEGTYIEGNTYCVDNIVGKEESQKILTKIQNALEDLTIRQKPTRYIFELVDEHNLENLRQFKTMVDEPDTCRFNINSQVLTVWADSADEYYEIVDQIRSKCPNVEIEDKEYSPSYFLEFKTNIVSMRQDIILKIENELRRSGIDKIRYDSIKNYSRNLFEYSYATEEDRDSFKNTIHEICDKYKNYLTLSFENEFGTTTYTLYKNDKLESDKERETIKNIRSATFIFLTPEEKCKLDEAISSYGDDAIFREGIQIGTLVRKDKDKLKFRISDSFDDLLNGYADDRIEAAELSKGFIKPIFPGELTNIGRMIKAMRKVTEPGGRFGSPANKNLPNFLFDPNTARVSEENLDEVKKRILLNLNEPLLKNQPKQLDAVAKAVSARDIALIQGPPGTGKTTVIAEIIWQTLLAEPDAKILVTSQTNLAVDNALERLKGKKLVRPIRIGNLDKFEDEGKFYSDKRMNEWMSSKPNSKEESQNAENAIAQWINNIIMRCSEDEQYKDVVEKWKKGLTAKNSLIKTTFSSEYLQHVNVFAATCSECGSKNFSEVYQSMFLKNKEIQGDPEFDLVIMDEASKATPPELVLPLTLGKRVVIIGDHKQLPPMIDEKEFSESLEAVGAKNLVADWTKQDYKISQFEKLFVNAPKNIVASLDTQFRMHEQIMNCISQFYKDQEELENGLICGIKNTMNIPDLSVKTSRWHGLELNPFINPDIHVIWVNVEDKEVMVGTSYENIGEVDAIKTVLRALTKSKGFTEYNAAFSKEEDKEIGVITYYMPQMMRIREALYPQFTKNEWRSFELHKYENEFHLPFRINTVDRFQGMERNIIIVSTVRSNRQINSKGQLVKNDKYPFALGFAREHPRVNVGFSRAKRLLIVIGNEKHFANKPEYAEAISQMHRVDISQLQNL